MDVCFGYSRHVYQLGSEDTQQKVVILLSSHVSIFHCDISLFRVRKNASCANFNVTTKPFVPFMSLGSIHGDSLGAIKELDKRY